MILGDRGDETLDSCSSGISLVLRNLSRRNNPSGEDRSRRGKEQFNTCINKFSCMPVFLNFLKFSTDCAYKILNPNRRN